MPARFPIHDDTYRVPVTSLGKRSREGIESVGNLLGIDWEDEVTVTPIKIGAITVEAYVRLEGVGPDGELMELITRPSEPNSPQLYIDGVELDYMRYRERGSIDKLSLIHI